MRAVEYRMRSDKVLKARIEKCYCPLHRANERAPFLWTEHLNGDPRDFVRVAACPRIAHPHLQAPSDDRPPKLLTWDCGNGKCKNCGVDQKLKILECPILKEYEASTKVFEWKDAKRDGTSKGKERKQKEPTEIYMPFKELLEKLCEHSAKSLKHVTDAEWYRVSRARLEKTFLPNEILIYTDFSATPSLEAIEKDNSSVAQHCILCIFVVMHSPRDETITLADGSTTTIVRVNSCTHWAVLGPTDGYGKKNDHVFHHTAIHHIVDFHERELKDTHGLTLKQVWVNTDNCSGQYKCRYVFYEIAVWAERHPGVKCTHTYAPVYEFKGVHDGVGKVIKGYMEDAEVRDVRLPSATLAFQDLLANYAKERSGGIDWKKVEEERGPKLLDKGRFAATETRFAYVTDDEVDCTTLKELLPDAHVWYRYDVRMSIVL